MMLTIFKLHIFPNYYTRYKTAGDLSEEIIVSWVNILP